MEQKENNPTDQVQEIKNELKRFAYAVSHDLQAPLRIVNGYIKIVQRQLANSEDEELKEYIGMAVAGAKQMEGYLADLLAYSRIMHAEVQPRPIKLANLVEVVKYGLREEIAASNAVVKSDAIPEIIEGNKELIKQLFHNLISNAIKFRRENETPVIAISGEKTDFGWSFQVTDNGIGIPENSYERVFELFQQLHPVDKYPGNGVGLAVCKKVVEMHGGKIEVSSSDGSTFSFYITG
jgi:light-regulated signal transduction histidine kinase (bacteriophytochrome)